MRATLLCAAACVTLAALAQGQHTVTEFRTVTTTMYRDREPTHGIDNGGPSDAPGPAPEPTELPVIKEPPPPMDEPPHKPPMPNPNLPKEPPTDPKPPKDEPPMEPPMNEPSGPIEPPKLEPSKGPMEPPMNEPPKDPMEPPMNEPPKDPMEPPMNEPSKGPMEPPKNEPSKGPEPPKESGAPPKKGEPTGTVPIGNKVKPSAGASKSGSATDFTFSPITLAPESSQGTLGASLRELTASHKPTGSSASAADSGAVHTSLSVATVLGMTLMGAVALAQL